MNYMQLPLSHLSLRNPIHLLALGLGSGLAPVAPGTFGSIVGGVIAYILLHWLNNSFFLILTALLFWLGCFICQKTAKDMGVHDHGAIVWDEIIGMFLTFMALPELSLFWCVIGFAIFRLFDIVKPYPIRYFDHKLHNGFGIMFDDILAALYSMILLYGLGWLI